MNRQQLIMQLGQYCNSINCRDCPIYESWAEGKIFNKCCMEFLRFPGIAKKMDEAVKKEKEKK